MRRHPAHQSSIHLRRRLYDAIQQDWKPFSVYLRARLAINTAWHVLPIFRNSLEAQLEIEADFEEDFRPLLSVPEDLLAFTESQVFNQQSNATEIEGLQRKIYQAVLVRFSGLYAMLAAYKASYEATCEYEFIEKYFFPSNQTLQDVDYGRAILSDTAASAAMAAACHPIRYEFNPARLLAFWEWWHNEALPMAWEMANQDAEG
ncbi:MAG: hypothetical protein HC915_11150 [Anaerolineae bacterium]|nr:hypothetical protein [Anaerolineae bacterium]